MKRFILAATLAVVCLASGRTAKAQFTEDYLYRPGVQPFPYTQQLMHFFDYSNGIADDVRQGRYRDPRHLPPSRSMLLWNPNVRPQRWVRVRNR